MNEKHINCDCWIIASPPDRPSAAYVASGIATAEQYANGESS